MAAPVVRAWFMPERTLNDAEIAADPGEAMQLNLHEIPNPDAQRAVLDGLPVLVFLERAGKIIFANAEARHLLGLAEGEWNQRPVEDVLWGLFPGTAEPQTKLTGTQH